MTLSPLLSIDQNPDWPETHNSHNQSQKSTKKLDRNFGPKGNNTHGCSDKKNCLTLR